MVPGINSIITQHFQKSHCVQSTGFFFLFEASKRAILLTDCENSGPYMQWECQQNFPAFAHTCLKGKSVLRENWHTESTLSTKAPFASQQISHHKIKSLGPFSGSDSGRPPSYVVGVSCASLWEDSSQPTLALMLTQREYCYGFFYGHENII